MTAHRLAALRLRRNGSPIKIGYRGTELMYKSEDGRYHIYVSSDGIYGVSWYAVDTVEGRTFESHTSTRAALFSWLLRHLGVPVVITREVF